MTDDAESDDKALEQNSGPQQSGSELKPLSNETVEGAKAEILFGVGYKRPPVQHRFKKGQSGNPKGRPKSAALPPDNRSANALALKHAERLITVRDGEEVKQISSIDAVFRAQIATAVKGNAYAQKQAIERYGRAEREKRQQIEEETEVWRGYVDSAREKIAKSEMKGEPPPALLPHPDDVVLDYDTGVRFIGPLSEEGTKRLEETCRMRDILIMQDALDRRQASEPDSTGLNDLSDQPGTALLFALTFNQFVPDRFKLSDDEFIVRMMRYQGLQKRRLLSDIHRGWQSLGGCAPGGWVFPPLRVGRAKLELIFDLVQRVRDGSLDIKS